MGAAAIGITHLSKGGAGSDPAGRVIGSVAFTAVARVVMVAGKVLNEDGSHKRILARGKSNIGPDEGGFEYHIEQAEPLPGINACCITWGASMAGTARELLQDATEDKDGESEDQSDAVTMLKDELVQDCWTPASVAMKPLLDVGFTRKQAWSASKKLNVIRHKSGFGPKAATYWKLPGGGFTPPPEPENSVSGTIDSTIGSIGSIHSTLKDVEPMECMEPMEAEIETLEEL